MKPVARKYRLDEVPDDRGAWRSLPLEARLEAVWEMARFWAELEIARAEKEGETLERSLDRLLPVAKRRPLEKP